MYLLMLLATFMSAIYGYNLSVRPDYDRDVPRKKAASIILKFKHQHVVAANIFESILVRGGSDGTGTCQTSESASTNDYCSSDGGHLQWALPDDMIYTTNTSKFEMVYKQGSSSEKVLYVRKNSKEGNDAEMNSDLLEYGFSLSGADEMISRILCINGELYDGTATTCEPMTTTEGYTAGSCCNTASHRYVISYMKIDARWLNKLTQAINLDFLDALQSSKFRDNTGAIIKYHDSTADSFWLFTGRIYFYPVYAQDFEAYLAEQNAKKEEAVENGEDPDAISMNTYSNIYMKRTSWSMPKYFGITFFKDKGGDTHFCDQGCLFRINEI
jgi:hypothetical protein